MSLMGQNVTKYGTHDPFIPHCVLEDSASYILSFSLLTKAFITVCYFSFHNLFLSEFKNGFTLSP